MPQIDSGFSHECRTQENPGGNAREKWNSISSSEANCLVCWRVGQLQKKNLPSSFDDICWTLIFA